MSHHNDTVYDLLVIGGGIAGLTAANHAALSGLRVGCLEGSVYGGLVANVEKVEGYPAVQPTSGIDLAMALMQANMDMGVTIFPETVGGIRLEDDLKLITTDGNTYGANRLIIATGGRLKRLGVPGELEFEYKGVSQCASCDGALFKDQEVVVVGGGDAALQEALVLTRFCSKVTIVHRGERFRAKQTYAKQVSGHERIEIIWYNVVEEILGNQNVEKIRVKNLKENRSNELKCSGLFAFIGITPNVDFVPSFIETDETGSIVTDQYLETSAKGIFAVGAVRKGYMGQLTHAVGDGTTAAISVSKSWKD